MAESFADDAAFGQRRAKKVHESDVQTRTYDIFWHDIIGRSTGQAGDADKTLMPKLMRSLAPPGSFFDPRAVWQAEQNKVRESEEEDRRRREEEGKKRQEGDKKPSRPRKQKEGDEDDLEVAAATAGAGASEAARGEGPSGRASATPVDEKWRSDLEPKVAAALKEVRAAHAALDVDSEKANQLLEDTVEKVNKLWDESASAGTKSQKTEIEKKLTKLVKDSVKQFKKIGEEESGGGGKGKKKIEVMRERQEAKRAEDSVDRDEERIANVVVKFKKTILSSLMQLKDVVATPIGRLRWMLEVLRWGLEKRDDVLVLDCLFTLREMPLFDSGRKELKARKEERKKVKDTDKKSKKGERPLSREAELLKEYNEVVDAAIAKLKGVGDVIEFQMTSMANRLPPLSRFSFGKSLDPWQKRVLGYMDQNKSVIVCAPTSSGKTVLSSYVTLRAEKILFVVPTEPLVWQVAAMFHHVLGGEVSLVTNQFAYHPTKENPKDWRCIVGTPLALESALTKPRGRIGVELQGRQEYHAFRGGFNDFQYAVYDEVHTLDGEEGGALQRIIKAVRCNFLALSATIGNGEALRDWWQEVHDQQVDDEIADIDAMLHGEGEGGREEGEDFEMLARAVKMRYVELNPELKDLETAKGKWRSIRNGNWPKKLAKESGEGEAAAAEDDGVKNEVNPRDIFTRASAEQSRVELVDHKARFINLQRWVWAGDRLKPLHPLAAVAMPSLKTGDLVSASLSFTPFDSWNLWERLSAAFEEYEDEDDEEHPLLGDVDAHDFLTGERITLEKSKQYEDKLKVKLTELSETHEREVQDLLSSFAPDTTVMETYNLYDVVSRMKIEGFFPALFFRLDTYRCVELFKSLLAAIEAAELLKYPTYYTDLTKKKLEQEEKARKVRAAAEKRKDKGKKKRVDEDTGERLEEDEGDDEGAEVDLGPPVDDTAPHEDFVLASPINRIVATDLEEILDKLKKDRMSMDHPYVKALRRGFGIYIDDSSLQEYPRVVQQLAQQGKLAVVFSDHSLAYGVNMPFRTSTFCGDDPELLTPLMAAQMSGRAGRRGLDEQGNLVYLGMSLERVQELMRGCIPAIRGTESRYPTMALQHALQVHHNTVYNDKTDRIRFYPEVVTERRMRGIASVPLYEWLDAREAGSAPVSKSLPHYYDRSLDGMRALHLLVDSEDVQLNAPSGVVALAWELREYLPEAIGIVHCLPYIRKKTIPVLLQKTVGVNFRYWAKKVKVEKLEGDFLTMLLPIVDRTSPKPGSVGLYDETYIKSNPEREALLLDIEARLRGSLKRLQNVAESERAPLLLKYPPAPEGQNPDLDTTLYRLVVLRKTPSSDPALAALTSQDWFLLKQRLWKLGTIIRHMHNCLNVLGEGNEEFAQILLWKTFRRIQFIMHDTFTGTSGEVDVVAEDDEDNEGDELTSVAESKAARASTPITAAEVTQQAPESKV